MELNGYDEKYDHASTSMKVLLLIFVVLVVGVLAYLVFAEQRVTYDNGEVTINVAKKSTPTATVVSTATATATATATVKAYTDAATGISFDYPLTDLVKKQINPINGSKAFYAVGLTNYMTKNPDDMFGDDFANIISINLRLTDSTVATAPNGMDSASSDKYTAVNGIVWNRYLSGTGAYAYVYNKGGVDYQITSTNSQLNSKQKSIVDTFSVK